jgi:RNA chaperone Hfq
MLSKPPPLQHLFFRKLITEKLPVTVFLVNGLKLQGAITEIDSFSMLIVSGFRTTADLQACRGDHPSRCAH